MKKDKLIKEEVFSTIEDKNLGTSLGDSPIWAKAKHREDVTKEDGAGFLYNVLFEGPTPVGCTSTTKFKV